MVSWSVKFFLSVLVLVLGGVLFTGTTWVSAVQAQTTAAEFIIINPYEAVNWAVFGQYRAALHVHTNRSDGGSSIRDVVVDYYNKGFDVVAITDHDLVSVGDWSVPTTGFPEGVNWWSPGEYWQVMSESDRDGVLNGNFTGWRPWSAGFTGNRPQSNGMIWLTNTNELSQANDTLAYWVSTNANRAGWMGWNQEDTDNLIENSGGIGVIAHPGRYTGGFAGGNNNPNWREEGAAANSYPATIARYVDRLTRFPSLIGMEIFNRLDNETRSDRILWDNLLTEMMPQGRNVWGFSNDDSHGNGNNGYNWNVLLMPTLDETTVRQTMETGAFYAVARVDRRLGINDTLPDSSVTPTAGGTNTTFMLYDTTPSIVSITADNGVITIEAADYDRIEWVADGQVIYTGATLDIAQHWSNINHNHVRAQIISVYGVAMTQPFGVMEVGAGDAEWLTIDQNTDPTNLHNNVLTVENETFVLSGQASGGDMGSFTVCLTLLDWVNEICADESLTTAAGTTNWSLNFSTADLPPRREVLVTEYLLQRTNDGDGILQVPLHLILWRRGIWPPLVVNGQVRFYVRTNNPVMN
jgi:hypothetical protein